jgi:hypothetical protein
MNCTPTVGGTLTDGVQFGFAGRFRMSGAGKKRSGFMGSVQTSGAWKRFGYVGSVHTSGVWKRFGFVGSVQSFGAWKRFGNAGSVQTSDARKLCPVMPAGPSFRRPDGVRLVGRRHVW